MIKPKMTATSAKIMACRSLNLLLDLGFFKATSKFKLNKEIEFFNILHDIINFQVRINYKIIIHLRRLLKGEKYGWFS